MESFNRGEHVIAAFLDVEKAFDKVWHNGLGHKIYQFDLPTKLCRWLSDFLAGRVIQAKIQVTTRVISHYLQMTPASGQSVRQLSIYNFIQNHPALRPEGGKPSPRDNHYVQKPFPWDKTGSQKSHPRDIKLQNFTNVSINSDTI